jgi:hypothetical protein
MAKGKVLLIKDKSPPKDRMILKIIIARTIRPRTHQTLNTSTSFGTNIKNNVPNNNPIIEL